jgi:hypothetical protein
MPSNRDSRSGFWGWAGIRHVSFGQKLICHGFGTLFVNFNGFTAIVWQATSGLADGGILGSIIETFAQFLV